MKKFLIMMLFCINSWAVYEVGDDIPEMCWTTLGGGEFCTSYGEGQPKVIVFNAGWCPPCNSELQELGQTAHQEFNPMQIIFVSMSAEGYQRGSKPDETFLQSWQKKHSIPFIVAGDYKNFGNDFFSSPAIPNVAIIGADNKLKWKAIGPEVSEIYEEARKLLY